MKVEIDFPADFEIDTICSLPIGRLLIGDSVFRIQFAPDGKVHIHGSSAAKEYIHFYDQEQILVGFGGTK